MAAMLLTLCYRKSNVEQLQCANELAVAVPHLAEHCGRIPTSCMETLE